MSLKDFSDYISDNIPKKALFCSSESQIVYECLKLVNFKSLVDSEESIRTHSGRVLKALLTSYYSKTLYSDSIRYFLRMVLSLKELPVREKIKLEFEARLDLEKVENLIKRYESDPFIASHIKSVRTPRNHEERTKLEFYKRTVVKREAILRYIFFELDEIAISKSRIYLGSEGSKKTQEILKEFESLNDFPYREVVLGGTKRWSFGINFERLDWKLINPLRNKADVFLFKESILNGFTNEINREILGLTDGVGRLENMVDKITKLPVINSRSSIFKELLTLYERSLWYGFYALALPQIEGIFSEMVNITKPTTGQKSSLTDKVNALRPFIDGSEYSFDYYEYYLPAQRNKFSHTGNDDDIELKCKCLILDLEHIIQLFEELKSPLLQVRKILDEGITYFQDVGRYARFLFLLGKIEDNQLSHLREELDHFVYQVMLEVVDFPRFIKGLQIDFNRCKYAVKQYFSLLLEVSNFDTIPDLFSCSSKDAIEIINRVSESPSYMTILFEEEMKLLLDTDFFIRNFGKRFNKIGSEISANFSNFEQRNRDVLDRIKLLNSKLKIDLPENFLINRNRLEHKKFLETKI